jgi:NADH-quinone oxidoreductase subunit M
MLNIPFASILIFFPLASCFFVLISKKDAIQNIKLTAMCGAISVIVITIISLFSFDFSKDTVQFMEEYLWIPKYNLKYKVGIDKYSIFFIIAISIISILAMLWVLQKNIHKTKHFFASVLLFESFSIGAFVSYDLFLLLFFMESTMIPLLVMMNSSGKDNHKDSILQLLVYGIIGSLCSIISMLIIHNISGTSDIIDLYQKKQIYKDVCFYLLLIGTGIKIPLLFLHYWLPKVHVESPTICSVLLASITLKFSSLMMIRIIHPLFLESIVKYTDLLMIICLGGAIVACANIFFQKDLKRIFVYFSILHMNLYMMILCSGCEIKKFVFSVLYHSLIMAVLFFVSDIIKTVFKTRDIEELQQVTFHFIKVKYLVFVSVLILIGIPPSWGFITEIIAIHAINQISTVYAIVAACVIFASSSYIFSLYQTIFGHWTVSTINVIDMFHISNISKNIVLYILCGFIFAGGVCAFIFL